MHIIDEQVFHSMRYHVFNAESEPVAVCMEPEDAAALVALLGKGSCIADPFCSIWWREGDEAFPASESYDRVAETVLERVATHELVLKRMSAMTKMRP